MIKSTKSKPKPKKVLLSLPEDLLQRIDASALRAKRNRSAEVAVHLEQVLPRRMRKATSGVQA